MMMQTPEPGSQSSITIYGPVVDNQTRCIHYHLPEDVIAIKFKCCDRYYPCYFCHEETAGHPAAVWSKQERHKKVVLCGVCKHEMTVSDYMNSGNECPKCEAPFNPACELHYDLYFEMV